MSVPQWGHGALGVRVGPGSTWGECASVGPGSTWGEGGALISGDRDTWGESGALSGAKEHLG